VARFTCKIPGSDCQPFVSKTSALARISFLRRHEYQVDIAGSFPAAQQALKDEFDQLYEEGAKRRRMTVISLHDRISGHATRVRALDRFLTYAKSKDGVWFARKDEIARYALANRRTTPVIDRGSANVTGLPGPTA
jgi:hypothetical protein